ncbi:PucR family transcriptional regulator [Streptomyces olivochromogenes]|uniref:PucR family transcriptional regulator n=1 Tax=Streptomyces olivochromogenes TaxID=1963 RepID=UPI001F3FC7B7|nr:helix-turn-helix domain-containing protein [Streptomyces olivochromogenes]
MANGSGVTVSVEAGAASPYERRVLYLPDPDGAPRMLHEVAAILGRGQEAAARRRATERRAADELAGPAAPADAVAAALLRCGLPDQGPYRMVVASTGERWPGAAEGALAEVAGHLVTGVAGATGVVGVAAVGRLPDGDACAVLPGVLSDGDLDEAWRLVAACEPAVPLHGGTAAPAAGPGELRGALAQARYGLTSARTTAPEASALTDVATLASLDTLLTGVPADVRVAYSRTVLGPLLDTDRAANAALLHTLHLHVNTVHYRVQRIEHFTGRDLSSLTDRLDLWAALLCRRGAAGSAG